MARVVRIDGANGAEILAADLDQAAAKALPEVRKVLQKGALNIKTDWRRAWTGLEHAPALPYAITYDTEETPTRVSAEIGADKEKRQGSLANLIEYGSVNNPPNPAGARALLNEEPRLEKALGDVLEGLTDQ
jgi:hypothetical protein